MRGRSLGWNQDYLIHTPLFFADLPLVKHRERVKRAFLRHPNVLKVSACYPSLGTYTERQVVYPEGKVAGEWEMQLLGIDEDFLDLYELALVAGRNIDFSTGTDSTQAYILNETAVKRLGWEDPIGKSFAWRDRKGTVIGVVEDFHTESFHSPIEPVVLFNWITPSLSIRIRPTGVEETMAFLEKTWKEFIPHRPFEYDFADEQVAGKYWNEVRQARIYGTLSILAISVACLGLLGLAGFTAERKTKEVGIRKAVGASLSGVLVLLGKEFAVLVAVAVLVACPVTYLLMRRWLDQFTYRIDLGPGLFLLGAVIAFAVAMLAVSWQTARAARTNPVEALRYE
jgi:putative ABC transport system permease protein